MAGQLIKRDDRTWMVRIFLGRDESDKRRYLNKTIKGSKKDAEKYLHTTLAEISSGTFVKPSSLTLDGFLDQWLESACRLRVSERTFAEYVALLKRYVRRSLGRRKLSEVCALEIQTLYSEMLERGLSARVVRYTHAVLSSALKQAVRWNILYRNPAECVQLPKLVRKEMKALTTEECGRFLAVLNEDRHHALFALALSTGMRPEEYLGLRWIDVDLGKSTLIVRRALVWRTRGGGWYFTEPKTSRSRRTIPLPTSMALALAEHKRRQSEERLRIGSAWQDNGLVFTTSIGTPLNISNLTAKHFKPALRQAGLPETIRLTIFDIPARRCF
jgi:integrase